MASQARRQEKQTAGSLGGKIKNSGSERKATVGPVEIKNAVGMCKVGKGEGYGKIKNTVSG